MALALADQLTGRLKFDAAEGFFARLAINFWRDFIGTVETPFARLHEQGEVGDIPVDTTDNAAIGPIALRPLRCGPRLVGGPMPGHWRRATQFVFS